MELNIMKLKSENGKWSFLDGYQIYEYEVVLLEKNDVKKYKLIDNNGNVIHEPTVDDIVYETYKYE